MEGGDCEVGRDIGERSADDSRLGLKDCRLLVSNGLGLSFPVGPLPKGGLFDGGRLRACRRQSFSASSSDILSSNALRMQNNEVNENLYHFSKISYLKVGSAPGPKRSLNIPSTVWGKIVVSFPTSFRGHRE